MDLMWKTSALVRSVSCLQKRSVEDDLLAHLEEAESKTKLPFHLDREVPKDEESTILNYSQHQRTTYRLLVFSGETHHCYRHPSTYEEKRPMFLQEQSEGLSAPDVLDSHRRGYNT